MNVFEFIKSKKSTKEFLESTPIKENSIQNLQRELGIWIRKAGISVVIEALHNTVGDFWNSMSPKGKDKFGSQLGHIIDALAEAGTVAYRMGEIDRSFLESLKERIIDNLKVLADINPPRGWEWLAPDFAQYVITLINRKTGEKIDFVQQNTGITVYKFDSRGDLDFSEHFSSFNFLLRHFTGLFEAANKSTKTCPDCGGKYLVATGYCIKCKKTVKKEALDEKQFNYRFHKRDKVIVSPNIILTPMLIPAYAGHDQHSIDLKAKLEDFEKRGVIGTIELISRDGTVLVDFEGITYEIPTNVLIPVSYMN